MKSKLLYIFFIIALSLSFTACSDDKQDSKEEITENVSSTETSNVEDGGRIYQFEE